MSKILHIQPYYVLLPLCWGIFFGTATAAQRIEAEGYGSMSGIQAETCSEGGENIGYIHTGDWAQYTIEIPKAGEYEFHFRVASKTQGGGIDLFLDQRKIGQIIVAKTGGWQAWKTISTTVNLRQTGKQTLRLNFQGESGYLFNINWFEIIASDTSLPREELMVSSIPQLVSVLGKSDVDVKMRPGRYYLDQDDRRTGILRNTPVFDISGSNATYDFTGVTLDVHTNIYDEYGNISVVVVDVTGSHNHIQGLTINDIGNERPYRSACGMYVTGDHNKIEDVSFYIRGSKPYAYGDLFGKGAGYVIKHWKHSALLVKGASNHILNCYVEMHAYGHGIFMQGAIDTVIEGCFVKGFTRTTDEVLAEKTGSAYDVDFETIWGWTVPPGFRFSLSEDGIRCYNSGSNGRDTANTTVKNCTVEGMRGGVTIGFSNGPNVISGCTVIGGETDFWVGDRGTVSHCQGEAANAALINHPYQGDDNQKYSITLLRETPVYGNEQLVYLGGHSHQVTLWNSSIQPRPFQQTIQMGGLKKGMRYMEMVEGRNGYTLSNTTLINWTDMPVVLDPKASDCHVTSFGPVSDQGVDNKHDVLSPVAVTTSNRSTTGYHTIDTDPDTYWSAPGRGQWILYDLGQTRNLYAVMIKWLDGVSRQYDFDIQTSSTSHGPWTTVYSGTSYGGGEAFEYYCFPTQNARYVKIQGRGNSVDTSMKIVELDIDLKDRFAMVKAKSDDGNVAQNTLDGDMNTYWSAKESGHWIQYDLLQPMSIQAISIAWYQGTRRLTNFDVKTSNHPMGPWETVFTGSSSGNTLDYEEYPCAPTEARFVRITDYGDSGHIASGIAEVFINTKSMYAK